MERIYDLENQIKTDANKRDSFIEVNRASKTVFEIFDNILNKEHLDKVDIGLIVEKIIVYANDTIAVKLKADIEQLLKTGTLPSEEIAVNFNQGSINNSLMTVKYNHKVRNQRAKVYTVNVISDGDGLIIRTVYPVVPPKVEYRLSDFGATIIPVLQAMCDWGDAYLMQQQGAVCPQHG